MNFVYGNIFVYHPLIMY